MKQIIRWFRIKIESCIIAYSVLVLSKIADDMTNHIERNSMFNESNGKFYFEVTEDDWRS